MAFVVNVVGLCTAVQNCAADCLCACCCQTQTPTCPITCGTCTNEYDLGLTFSGAWAGLSFPPQLAMTTGAGCSWSASFAGPVNGFGINTTLNCSNGAWYLTVTTWTAPGSIFPAWKSTGAETLALYPTCPPPAGNGNPSDIANCGLTYSYTMVGTNADGIAHPVTAILQWNGSPCP